MNFMRKAAVPFVAIATLALLHGQAPAQDRYVTRGEFNELRAQVSELAALQRETLAAIRGQSSYQPRYTAYAPEGDYAAPAAPSSSGYELSLTLRIELSFGPSAGAPSPELAPTTSGYAPSYTGYRPAGRAYRPARYTHRP